MAKLKAPLLSLGAAGQLGKTIVYFPWKGLNAAREYVVPANPQTSGQTTQRGYVTAAVAKIHACQALAANALDAADVMAYALWANQEATPRTWFNQAVKNWVDVEIAGNVPIIYCDGTVSDPTHDSIDMILYIEEKTGSTLAAGKFYFGTSPTALIHSAAATVTAGDEVHLTNSDLSAFITAGVKYYWQFRPDAGDGCEGAYSGIYHFTAT